MMRKYSFNKKCVEEMNKCSICKDSYKSRKLTLRISKSSLDKDHQMQKINLNREWQLLKCKLKWKWLKWENRTDSQIMSLSCNNKRDKFNFKKWDTKTNR